MATGSIGFGGVLTRFLIAFALVCLTWNPTRYNYVDWAMAQWQNLAPLVAFVGIALAGGWFFFLQTTARSLGGLGLILCMGLGATVLWSLFYYDLVTAASTTVLTWIVLLLLSAILAAGMSWAHLRARWSGQATVDDVEQ